MHVVREKCPTNLCFPCWHNCKRVRTKWMEEVSHLVFLTEDKSQFCSSSTYLLFIVIYGLNSRANANVVLALDVYRPTTLSRNPISLCGLLSRFARHKMSFSSETGEVRNYRMGPLDRPASQVKDFILALEWMLTWWEGFNQIDAEDGEDFCRFGFKKGSLFSPKTVMKLDTFQALPSLPEIGYLTFTATRRFSNCESFASFTT